MLNYSICYTECSETLTLNQSFVHFAYTSAKVRENTLLVGHYSAKTG